MWSEWIQPADKTQPPFRRMIAYDSSTGTFSELAGSSEDAKFWIGSSLQWNAVQFRSFPPDLSTLPNQLASLTEGVDYTAKPGAYPDDPYRFVDYEGGVYAPEAHTIQRWVWPTFAFPFGGPYIDHTTGSPGSGIASIVEPTDYDDVDTDPFIPGVQGGGIPTKPPGGVQFATFTGAEAPGTELADPPDVGPHEAFTLLMEFDGDGSGDDRIYFTVPRNPAAVYRPPRFRYWIPGTIPLRQYHRDDGLGVTPPRAFGGASRIRTGRAYGYD